MGGFRLPFNTSQRAPGGPANGTVGNGHVRNGNAQAIPEFLKNLPDAGIAGVKRNSTSKPAPGGGRPKPTPKPVISLPKCKALYEYEAKDIDELTLKEGSIIEIVMERKSNVLQFLKIIY